MEGPTLRTPGCGHAPLGRPVAHDWDTGWDPIERSVETEQAPYVSGLEVIPSA